MCKIKYFLGIGFLIFLISCKPVKRFSEKIAGKPVKIVSAKYNGSDIIHFPCGNIKIIP